MKTGRNPAPDLCRRLRAHIERHTLLARGERVLVACSGGADSLALLDLLARLSEEMGWSLAACYVDHRQHPRAAAAARRVERHCRRLGVPFVLRRADPLRAAPGSNEEALRRERTRLLEEAAEELGCRRIATAHTRDDQAETVLLRILRGTGVAGLRGIPLRRGRFIRPLLWCSKDALQAYCRSRRLAFDRDPANRDPRFLRNRIRREVLPRLRRLNPAADQALVRLSRAAARDERALLQSARAVALADGEGAVRVAWKDASRLPAAVLSRVLVLSLRRLLGPGRSIPLLHFEALRRRVCRGGERAWSLSLPGGVTARREGKWLALERPGVKRQGFRLRADGPGEIQVPRGRLRFSWRRFRFGRAGPARVFFDPDQVRFPLVIRSLRPGDRLQKWGGGSREVCRILMDEKIPLHERALVPLLCQGRRILWIAGVRRSRHAGVAAAGRLALCVEYLPAGANVTGGSSGPGG